MKNSIKNILIFGISLILLSFKIQLIDTSFETFNGKKMKLVKESTIMSQGKYRPHYTYIIKNNKYTSNISRIVGVGYNQWIYYKDGFYELRKNFYDNKNIKSKYLVNRISDQEIGKEYRFDIKGNLVKIINHDKGWNMTFKQLIRISNNYGKRYDNYKKMLFNEEFWHNDYVMLFREEYEGRKYWAIGFNQYLKGHNEFENQKRFVVLIDDKSGKIIKEKCYIDQWNHSFNYMKGILKSFSSNKPCSIHNK